MNPDWSSGSVRPPNHRAARLALAVVIGALAVLAGHVVERRWSARAALAAGEEAFRRGDFRNAAARFKLALDHDPAATAVRLRLVAAYHKQYVPGGESRANLEVATQTLAEIARVLERDPSNRAAIAAAAEIEDGRSDYDQARDWYRRLTAIDSSSATGLAGASAAALKQVSGSVFDAEARAGLVPAAFALRASAPKAGGRPIASEDIRKPLAERWSATIADGIDAATRALAIDPENDGMLRMLSAWHALAADLAASSDEYQRHMTSANVWRHKAHEARRLKAERGSR